MIPSNLVPLAMRASLLAERAERIHQEASEAFRDLASALDDPNEQRKALSESTRHGRARFTHREKSKMSQSFGGRRAFCPLCSTQKVVSFDNVFPEHIAPGGVACEGSKRTVTKMAADRVAVFNRADDIKDDMRPLVGQRVKIEARSGQYEGVLEQVSVASFLIDTAQGAKRLLIDEVHSVRSA